MAEQSAERVRREPPAFRRVQVRSIEALTERMRRVVLAGEELEGFEPPEPAASVRLLLPPPGDGQIVMPTWTGNQFELPDGRRAPIRTFTPRYFDGEACEMTLDIVVHDEGAASDWVRSAETGDEVAVSGPGRGYAIADNVGSYLLAGDETAVPAIGQLLETFPPSARVEVHIEIADDSARMELPTHPNAGVYWHEAVSAEQPGATLVKVVESLPELADRIWVAGEAASVQRIRKHLFEQRGLDRSVVTARGYWKQGRSAT